MMHAQLSGALRLPRAPWMLRGSMPIVLLHRARATATGRVVGMAELKLGRLVGASRFARLFLTTTLTDVIMDLCSLAESLDSGYRIVPIVPNAPKHCKSGLSPARQDSRLSARVG
jgi:hypothetical protein